MTYIPVGGALAGRVDAIWVMRSSLPAITSPAASLLPQLHWTLQGRLAWTFPNGRTTASPPAAVMGPSSGAVIMHTTGPLVAVGVGLYPEGWATLVEEPAHRLTSDVADLVSLWGCQACRPLLLQPDMPDRAIAEQVLGLLERRHFTRELQPDPRIALVSLWADRDGGRIDGLSRELGLSARQLDRLVASSCGVPPRRLANKQRALRIATALAEGQGLTRDVWAELYSDQAHFIREFRRFIGVTPGAFLSEEGALVRGVFEVRREVNALHPLGLGDASTPLRL